MSTVPLTSSHLQQRISDAEWQARVKLAQACHLAAKLRWSDHIYTHFSLRVPMRFVLFNSGQIGALPTHRCRAG